MTLIVCPEASLAAVCCAHAPSGVVTLAAPGRPAPRLRAGIRHLHLAFHDIAEPRDGLVPPDAGSVEKLLAFGRGWTRGDTLVVSCELGVSRSTAAAFCLWCQAHPTVREEEVAGALRRASPVATPNGLVVALADAQLRRGGRMVAAAAAIGRGVEYRPYGFFALSRDASRA